MAQGNNMTAMYSQQTRLNTNQECHSYVTKQEKTQTRVTEL